MGLEKPFVDLGPNLGPKEACVVDLGPGGPDSALTAQRHLSGAVDGINMCGAGGRVMEHLPNPEG